MSLSFITTGYVVNVYGPGGTDTSAYTMGVNFPEQEVYAQASLSMSLIDRPESALTGGVFGGILFYLELVDRVPIFAPPTPVDDFLVAPSIYENVAGVIFYYGAFDNGAGDCNFTIQANG